jgi:hypothetical protein
LGTLNLNQSPYYDDFNADNNYYRVLFKPSYAVQARELTTSQSITQNQITSFGQNIFVNGTIVQGCNIQYKPNLAYVKLTDTYANGAALTVSDLNQNYIVSNTGLKAYILNSNQGYLATPPYLNTLFISYINSATSNAAIKVFQNDETLTVVSSSNLTIGQVIVANTISSGSSNTTGLSYSVSVNKGIIFQNGVFVNVEPQSLVITPYTNQPNNLSVGFECIESIVTSFQDPSLYDMAQGSPNYAAPGADRLKIVPVLTARNSTSNSVTSGNFFSIVDFIQGQPSIVNQDTTYATIGQKMADYSYETNGNFVVNPFNVRTITNYLSTGAVDTQNVRLEIDAGLAFIQGYKVQIIGKVLGVLPKGNTVKNAPSQIVTTQFGNYIQVQEYAGVFNPTTLQQVSLRSVPAYAISNNMAKGIPTNSITAPGVEIGKANVIGVEYDSGIQGLNSCVYDLYLFNIQMNSGYSFSSVKSFYANNAGVLGFADITSAGPIFNDTTIPTLLYSFNQSAISTLKNSSNTIDSQFEFIGSSNINFSNTGSATVTVPTYAGGTNELPFGTGLLTTPQKEVFFITCEGNATSVNLTGTISANQNVITGSGTQFLSNLFSGCYINFGNSSVTEIKQVSSVANNTSLTLVQPATYSWAGVNYSIQFLSGMEIPTSLGNTSISVSGGTSFTINLNLNLSNSLNAVVTYPIQRIVASPAKKQLQTSVFVKINLANNAGGTSGPWSLGLPDVFSVKNIWYGSSYSNTNPNVTSQFTLHNGQSDLYYGLAYLTNNGATLSNTNVLLVQVEAFLKDTSQGAGFFSIDSYPIDDTGLTSNTIFTQDIQTYTSISNGSTFNLRNSVDFRFYSQNTIPYISNVSLAIVNNSIINPSNTLTFNNSNLFLPLNGAEFNSSLQYYVGRYDVVGLNSTGGIIVNPGVPSENPVPGGDVQGGMTLATIYIPPYPTLTVDIVDSNKSNGNPVSSLVYNTNRRYTMQDIGILDQRITQAQYYAALSVLEQSAQNLLLTTQSGQTRFQNGVLADPFNDFSIANTLDPEFNIAIDGNASEVRPTFTQFLVDLEYSNTLSTGIEQSPNDLLITLDYTQAGPIISQPFASQVRNASEDILYDWTGNVTLNPSGDYQPDTTVNPAVVVDLDSYSNWVNLANAWGTQWGTWNETSSSSSSSSSSAVSQNGDATTTSTTTSTSVANTYTSTGTQLSVTPVNTTYNFGSYVTDVALQPFCRANLIKFYAYGMKPSTQVWTFFNDTPISQYCVQTDSNYNILNQNDLITTSDGEIWGYFYLPANTFYTGSIVFQILDIESLITESNIITSVASTNYQGTNLAYTTNAIDLQTESAQLTVTTVSQSMVTYSNTSVTSNNTVVTVPSTPAPAAATSTNVVTQTRVVQPASYPNQNSIDNQLVPGHCDGGGDPIAQQFTIPSNQLPTNVQGIYVTSLDVFFFENDPTLGISLMIVEMDNGYPSTTIVPGSQVHISPSSVVNSGDSSIATNIVFPQPVLLLSGSSYAFVLTPDGNNPNYDLWTGVISGTDILTNSPIYSLSLIGDMFLSSQGTTWTPYQNESIKFNLYYANFNPLSGTATFTNDDSEYLSVYSTSRVFQLGESVFYSNNVLRSGNISVTNTSSTVYGNTSGLLANTKIYLFSNTNNSTMIANVNSVTTGSFVVNTVPLFTDNNCSMGILTANGGLTGIIKSVNSSIVCVVNSTANSTVFLSTNNGIIIGSQSLASAAIGSLNDIPYDTVMPKFATSVPSVCNLAFYTSGISNSYLGYIKDTNLTSLTFGSSIDFLDKERVVMSKSNEMNYNSGSKSLLVYAGMSSNSNYLSPALNLVKSGMLCVQNLVNGEDSNNDVFNSEVTNNGEAINKYVSTTVTLLNGLEGEDLLVYVGAYYPPNTSIYCYCKLLNQYDNDPFSLKSWTPMYTTNATRSSKINNQDFNQYVFGLPNTIPSGNTFLNTAYLNQSNGGVVQYTSNSGSVYSTYNSFAVKLVLLSNAGSYLVPRLTDMTAIATTASG